DSTSSPAYFASTETSTPPSSTPTPPTSTRTWPSPASSSSSGRPACWATRLKLPSIRRTRGLDILGSDAMIRWLLRLTGSVRLRDEDLLGIAKQHCQEAGWSWTEPILLQHRLFRTLVTTNIDMHGG